MISLEPVIVWCFKRKKYCPQYFISTTGINLLEQIFIIGLDNSEHMIYTNKHQRNTKDLSKSYKRCCNTSDWTGLDKHTNSMPELARI